MVEKKEYTSNELAEWLIEKAGETKEPKVARKLIMANDPRGRDISMIGKLYFFKYDPKGKAYLPKYDRFPMVFPIEIYEDGFLGLNLHYLDVGQRQALIDKLMRFRNNEKLDESTRLKLSYDLLQGSRKLSSLSKPSAKRYLYNHCRSHFIEVYINEYDKAIQLSVEDWVIKG